LGPDRHRIRDPFDPYGMMNDIRHAGARQDMQTVIRDLRYAIRQLAKSPGFTSTAVLSLALGVGATTAVFSVIYAALLNPYPYFRRPNASCAWLYGTRPAWRKLSI
jgi:hypothetical protein